MRSGRRCCICFGLDGDLRVKRGQIAHLDRNPQNSEAVNLAFLCLHHHDEYDTKTSQARRWSSGEVKNYRKLLYRQIAHLREGDNRKGSRVRRLAVLDTGRNLHAWDRGCLPRLKGDYHSLRSTAAKLGAVVVERDLLDFPPGLLKEVTLLVLVCPKDAQYSQLEIERIVQFVRSGGRLLLMAYYWWHCDHDTNIGELTERFGIILRDDRVCDPVDYEQHEYQPKCLSLRSGLAQREIVVPFACSMKVGAPAEPLLSTGEHAQSEAATRVNRQIVRSFDTRLQGNLATAAWAQFKRGRVVVLGSWELLIDELCSDKRYGNGEFLGEVLSWLGS